MARPDWLPEGWSIQPCRWWEAVECGFCDQLPDMLAIDHTGNELVEVAWCNDCETKAKAAICGGEDGE